MKEEIWQFAQHFRSLRSCPCPIDLLRNPGENNRASGTVDENAAVVKGSIAYFDTYTLNGDMLKMHIEASTFPNWNNTDQTRLVHLSGNPFTWENAAASAGGGGVKLLFERVR